jgi:folate-binding protein YgfZ
VWGKAEDLESQLKEQGMLTSGEIHSWRMETLRPWYSVELTPDVMPLEVGLLDGITQGKGCYPGQEVIERILTQGAPPRRLARIQTSDGARILGLVKKSETAVGTRVQIIGPSGEKIEGQVDKCVEFNVL